MANIEANLDKEQLSTMKVDELRKLAADMGLETTGRKAELIERITAETVSVKEPDEPEMIDKDEALELLKEQNRMLQEQMKALQEQMAAMARPQVVQVSADTEKVHLLWQAEVADDNVLDFGEGGMYGRIVGKTGSVFVPKPDLSRVLSSLMRYLIDKRWLLIVSGLTEEERDALGVNYKEGEVLDKKAFAKMVELGDEMLNIYPKLCNSHKEMVARRYWEAYQNGDRTITRDRVEKLQEMTDEAGLNVQGFRAILEDMNQKFLKK